MFRLFGTLEVRSAIDPQSTIMHTNYSSPSQWLSLPTDWYDFPKSNSSSYVSRADLPSEPEKRFRHRDPFSLDPVHGKSSSLVSHYSRPVPSRSPSMSNVCPAASRYYPRDTGHQDIHFSPSAASSLSLLDQGATFAERVFYKPLIEETDSTPQDRVPLKQTETRVSEKGARPRRGRTVFSTRQLHELENVFIHDQYISGQQRRRLSVQLGLTETQVRVWFQNRRIKWRKQMLELKMKA